MKIDVRIVYGKNEDYPEEYCHSCGAAFASSKTRPVCDECIKKSEEESTSGKKMGSTKCPKCGAHKKPWFELCYLCSQEESE